MYTGLAFNTSKLRYLHIMVDWLSVITPYDVRFYYFPSFRKTNSSKQKYCLKELCHEIQPN